MQLCFLSTSRFYLMLHCGYLWYLSSRLSLELGKLLTFEGRIISRRLHSCYYTSIPRCFFLVGSSDGSIHWNWNFAVRYFRRKWRTKQWRSSWLHVGHSSVPCCTKSKTLARFCVILCVDCLRRSVAVTICILVIGYVCTFFLFALKFRSFLIFLRLIQWGFS